MKATKGMRLIIAGACLVCMLVLMLVDKQDDPQSHRPDSRIQTRSESAMRPVSRRPFGMGKEAPWLNPEIPNDIRSHFRNSLLTLDSLADPDRRDDYLDDLISDLESIDEVYAAMVVCESLEANPSRRQLMLAVLSRWVQLDPAQAGLWAQSQRMERHRLPLRHPVKRKGRTGKASV